MAEQVGLALFFGPEAPGYGLRRRVFLVDAVDDVIELEGREGPIDRRTRGFDGIALAAEIAGNAPADFKARPARRKPRAHPANESSAGFFLDHEHARAMQRPVPGDDGCVPPADQLVGHGLAIDGDESRGAGIGQHRRVWRDVGAAPLPQLQTLGVDDGAVGPSKRDALLEGSNHRYFHSLERDDFSSNRHPALSLCLSMISGQTLRVGPEGKPPSIPDQVRDRSRIKSGTGFFGIMLYAAFLSRSNASRSLAFRATAASRFSFSSSTISSGALATNFSLVSLASTRLMSASALANSLSSRAFSAERSITPFSGNAATSPRTSNCTAPSGAVSANEMSASRAIRLTTSFQRCARPFVSADAPASTSGVNVAGGIFISARTERIAVTRSTTQPISASAASSVRPSGVGQRVNASKVRSSPPLWGRDREGGTTGAGVCGLPPSPPSPTRGEGEEAAASASAAVTAQSSSVMKGMKGCSSFRISSRAHATMARVSDLAAPSSPINTGFASSRYQSQ